MQLGSRPMYRLVCLLILLLYISPVFATSRYITDELRVPLRKSPCARCIIVHRGLKSGLKLVIIETRDGWSHITTPDGLEGWLESQYLIGQPIARHQISNIRQQTSVIKTRNTELASSLSSTQNELVDVKKKLGSLNEEHSETVLKLKEIRKISANTLNLNAQNQQLLKQNKMLQSEIDILTATTEQLTASQTQKWFFYGALAVFMGAILSIIIPRLRPKRRGFSEWG